MTESGADGMECFRMRIGDEPGNWLDEQVVAIQDIFAHTFNAAQNISFRQMTQFQVVCKQSVKCIRDAGQSLRY